MKRLLSPALIATLLFGFIAADVRAQATLTKSPQIVALFREVIVKPAKSTVRVLADGNEAALGIVVASDGWILSKYSELKGKKLVCKLPGGKELEAEMMGFDVPFDLVMLKVDAKGLEPVLWSDSKVAHLGHWVASPGLGKDPVAIGVVSVLSREVKGSKFVVPTGAPGGYLGIALDLEFAGVKIQEVLPKTPASTAGLKNDDLIVGFNNDTPQNADEFLSLISRKKPGDSVKLKIMREDKELEFKITLGERPGTKGGKSRGEQQNNMGSKLSERRAGFPIVLQHDSVLKPQDCGGPLCNLDGKVIGINISRAGRTETYAVPSEVVRPMLEKLKTRKAVEEKTKTPEKK